MSTIASATCDIADPSRRRFLASLGALGAAAMAVPTWLNAQETGIVATARGEAAKSAISVRALRGNVHVLEGSGGNIGVFAGRDGKLLVDAGFPVSRSKITAALQRISADPIKSLVNTHWHFDHTDGNEWLHAAGATIIAHDNTRNHLSKATRVEGWQHTFPKSPAGALPTVVFTDEQWKKFSGRLHYMPGELDAFQNEIGQNAQHSDHRLAIRGLEQLRVAQHDFGPVPAQPRVKAVEVEMQLRLCFDPVADLRVVCGYLRDDDPQHDERHRDGEQHPQRKPAAPATDEREVHISTTSY